MKCLEAVSHGITREKSLAPKGSGPPVVGEADPEMVSGGGYMKKLSFSILVLLLAGLLGSVTYAQDFRQLMSINIPFDFVVGNKSLPSGEYYVLGSAGNSFIWIRDLQGKMVAITNTVPNRSPDRAANSALHFNRYGDTYFLHKVVVAGLDIAKELSKSKREREVQLASAGAAIATVQSASAAIK
jgi:hypothetical protein